MSMEERPPEGPRAQRTAYRVLKAAEWMGMHVPRPLGLLGGEVFMRMQLRRSPEQRAVVAANMAQVLGHPVDSPFVDRAVRECFRLYGRYWYETFALRSMPPEEVNRRFTIEGREHIDNALAEGRGWIGALPHMGNWDAAGHWLAVNGYRMTAVAEELKPPEVFELFLRHRRALGMGIVPLTGDRKAGEAIVRLLGQNEVITLVADRDLTPRGVRVEMFGAPRLLPAGPAFLSLMTGAPLSVASVFTTDEGWRCVINPPIEIERSGDTRRDVTEMTTLIAAQFESFIASAPTDWHMFQPAWEALPAEPEKEAAPVGSPASP
jgi:phosphatidylinositol dimannoside acyltransferase